jgi:hypothetical protein
LGQCRAGLSGLAWLRACWKPWAAHTAVERAFKVPYADGLLHKGGARGQPRSKQDQTLSTAAATACHRCHESHDAGPACFGVSRLDRASKFLLPPQSRQQASSVMAELIARSTAPALAGRPAEKQSKASTGERRIVSQSLIKSSNHQMAGKDGLEWNLRVHHSAHAVFDLPGSTA